MFKKLKFALYLSGAVIITLGLSISLQSLLAAWTAPSASAPSGNVYPPINQGTVTQTIGGGLTIGSVVANGLSVTGNSIFNNNLTVTGNLSAASFTGNGSGLTNVAASSIAWSNITSKPTEFVPSAGSAYYRNNTWVPSWADISSKPTTISGFGIMDAITTGNIGSYADITADTIADDGIISAGETNFTNQALYTTSNPTFNTVRSATYVTANNLGEAYVGAGGMNANYYHSNTNDSWFAYPGNNYNYFRGATYAFNSTWYDESNTAYYVDPNNVSIFNDMRANVYYDFTNTGYYMVPRATSRMNEIQANRVYGFTDIRSPIFYDYNNTGYYVDPAGTSRLNYGIYDSLYSGGTIQAPSFYDNNDNNYYVDPNASSKFNNAVFTGTVSFLPKIYTNTTFSTGHFDVSVSCGAGGYTLGGGCEDASLSNTALVKSFPLGLSGWYCRSRDISVVTSRNLTAYVICTK